MKLTKTIEKAKNEELKKIREKKKANTNQNLLIVNLHKSNRKLNTTIILKKLKFKET